MAVGSSSAALLWYYYYMYTLALYSHQMNPSLGAPQQTAPASVYNPNPFLGDLQKSATSQYANAVQSTLGTQFQSGFGTGSVGGNSFYQATPFNADLSGGSGPLNNVSDWTDIPNPSHNISLVRAAKFVVSQINTEGNMNWQYNSIQRAQYQNANGVNFNFLINVTDGAKNITGQFNAIVWETAGSSYLNVLSYSIASIGPIVPTLTPTPTPAVPVLGSVSNSNSTDGLVKKKSSQLGPSGRNGPQRVVSTPGGSKKSTMKIIEDKQPQQSVVDKQEILTKEHSKRSSSTIVDNSILKRPIKIRSLNDIMNGKEDKESK